MKSLAPLFCLLAGVVLVAPAFAKEPPRKAPRGANPILLEVGDESVIKDVPREELIAFAMYTVQDDVLKLSAQLYPLKEDESHEVVLEVEKNGNWEQIATATAARIGWTATFRVEGWDHSKDVKYRVSHSEGSSLEGLVRKDPSDKEVIQAAVYTGNSPGPGGGKISKQDVVDYTAKLDPDILIFTGDQVYNHYRHTERWLKFGELFKEVMKDRPTVNLPDDHDIGQPNMWGGGGGDVDLDTKGGYVRPAGYVKMVERQQTAHMPDPFDPTPIQQGIGVYYTSLNIGGIDFAILEDRKFKSGCFDLGVVEKGLGTRPDHIYKNNYDPEQFDVEGKKLLGDRQLTFLDAWGQDWDGVTMKAVVSQTLFNMASTHGGGSRDRYYADFDANGWPQTGRDKAIEAMRSCYAVHLCGDQHLSSLVHYGVDDWRDSNWCFVVPSIANLYPRWWAPDDQEGQNPEPGAQEHTGDFIDGFGNKITVKAHTNPAETGRQPAELHDRKPGFGVVYFNKPKREITFHNWPRMIDPTDPANAEKQHEGWPRTISQFDNYGREAVAWLPTLKISGAEDPVVQVIAEDSGEILYTLRILGTEFQPKVFAPGTYTIKVNGKEVAGVEAVAKNEEVLEVTFP